MDKLLDQHGIREALARRGLELSESQIERAVIRHKNGTRRVPVVPCPITGKLVILESDLEKWFERTYRSADSGSGFGTELAQSDSRQNSASTESTGYGTVIRGEKRRGARL